MKKGMKVGLLLLVLFFVSIGSASATCVGFDCPMIFANSNGLGVESAFWYGSSAPPAETKFTLDQDYFITEIWDYHYYHKGEPVGTIALQNVDTEVIYGPWPGIGSPYGCPSGCGSVPNVNWNAEPNVIVPKGTYRVIDSYPSTWSYNAASGGQGFTGVWGYPTTSGTSDTVPPTLSLVPDKAILWPPNNKMVPVTINTAASDNSGLPVTLAAAVASNEPQSGPGPDFTTPVIDQQTGIITLQLRSDRMGNGSGRTYTILITATDAAYNSTTAVVNIIVPHDQGKK